MSAEDAVNPDIRAAVTRLLADTQPRDFDEILDAVLDHLGDRAPDDAEDALDEILCADRYHLTADEDFFDLVALLDGRVFTHRLDEAEARTGSATLRPDLAMVAWSFEKAVPLAKGGEATIDVPGDPFASQNPEVALIGPDGWLEGAGAGDLLGFTLTDGALGWHPATADADASRRAAEALSNAFDRCHTGGSGAVHLVDVVADCLIEDPSAFSVAVDPLADLLEAAEMERRGDWLGRVGSEWLTPGEIAHANRRGFRERVFGFSECCHEALELITLAFAMYGTMEGHVPKAIAKVLSHGLVAEAFAHDVLQDAFEIEDDAAALLEFAAAVRTGARGKDVAAARYLEGMAHDALEDLPQAERAMQAALAADPTYASALDEAAWHCELRGNWARSAEYLRRAGADDDDRRLQAVLENAARAGAVDPRVGRNEPCPCGSGKKYKSCCLGRERVPLNQRAQWLHGKAVAYAHRPRVRNTLIALADAVVASPEDPASADAFAAAVEHPLLVDIALFEEQVFDEFLEVAAPLLPADEVAMGEGWLERPRALYEVVETREAPSEGDDVQLPLRDTRSGEVLEIAWGGDGFEAGELLLGRVGPAGDRWRAVGSLTGVPLRLRESLLELTAEDAHTADWLAWLRVTLAPPVLQNREGEPILMCEATYRVKTKKAAIEALAEVFEIDEDEPGVFHETVEVDGDVLIRGWVRVEGKKLTITTNSAERFDRLLAAVDEALPDAKLVAEERLTPAEVRARGDGGEPATGIIDPASTSPEEREIVAGVMRKLATKWVDEPVPALGGLTPRQALDDPTRREDLLALLREFDRMEREHDAPFTGMPVSLVRELLGLDAGDG